MAKYVEEGIVPIKVIRITEEFLLVGMEYCPNGSLERCIVNRNGAVMYEDVSSVL